MPHNCGTRPSNQHNDKHLCQKCKRDLAVTGTGNSGDENNINSSARPTTRLNSDQQRQPYFHTPRRFNNNRQFAPFGGHQPFLNWHRRNPPPPLPQTSPTQIELQPSSAYANTSASEISVKSAPAEYAADDDAVKCADATFKSGQNCWAPYIDGNHYPARFEMLGPADLCVVFFHSFGHHSYVPVASITPK